MNERGINALRLNKADMFRTVYKTGVRIEDNGLFLFCAQSPDQQTRVATVVRKKLYRNAVDRNRIRRVCRELVRTRREHMQQPCWFIFDIKQRTSINTPAFFYRCQALLERSGVFEVLDEE